MTWRTPQGYRAGYADGLVGIKSDYAWFAFTPLEREYTLAYRRGWQDAANRKAPNYEQ
jgi:hypothetical protein